MPYSNDHTPLNFSPAADFDHLDCAGHSTEDHILFMQVNCIVIHATKSSNICINITFFINMLYARYVDVIKNFTGHDKRSRSSGNVM